MNLASNQETAVIVNGVEAEELLENIAADLRQLLPLEAQLPSETIIFPKTGQVLFICAHNIVCIL